MITTDGPDSMPSAAIWAAGCDTTFTVSGDSGDVDIQAMGETTFEAGSTRYYANFLQMETPTAETTRAINAAIAKLADSLATRYKALTTDLTVGMPAGIDVEGWQAECAAGESEALATTGSNDTVLAGSALLIAVLGSLAAIARKSRRARS